MTTKMTRRQGREFALQVLYLLDMFGSEPRQALGMFWNNFEPSISTHEFTDELVIGAWGEKARLDRLIADAAENWRLGRLPRVELNLLRLGAYELLSYPNIAPGVTINEAIEIARRFCSDESSTFINGILDHIATAIGKKAHAHEPTV